MSRTHPMYGVEVILTTTTTHAKNHASADLDSYLVDVLEREGFMFSPFALDARQEPPDQITAQTNKQDD